VKGSKGGMQAAAANYAIYCPVCGHWAARKHTYWDYEFYYHTHVKKPYWHGVKKEAPEVF